MSYEPYNHTTVRPFKGDELMRENILRTRVFCIVHRWSLHAKMFSGLDLNQEGEALTDSSESRPWG